MSLFTVIMCLSVCVSALIGSFFSSSNRIKDVVAQMPVKCRAPSLKSIKLHFLFSSFNSHLQQLLSRASLHLEVRIIVFLCFWTTVSVIYNGVFPAAKLLCFSLAQKAVFLRAACLVCENIAFLHVLPTPCFFTDICYFIIVIYISALPYRVRHMILISLVYCPDLSNVFAGDEHFPAAKQTILYVVHITSRSSVWGTSLTWSHSSCVFGCRAHTVTVACR